MSIVRRIGARARAIKSSAGLAVYRLRRLLLTSPRQRRHDREAATFQKLMEANTSAVYDQMYGDQALTNHYLVDERIDFYRVTARKVRAHLTIDPTTAACLDVGCGTGHLLAELRRLGFSGRMVGIDAAPSAGTRVVEHGASIEFYPGLLSEQCFDETFDLILCTEVLEHCDDPISVVKEMIAATRPRGQIVITVPDGRKDTWDGHIHFWSPESFRYFIRQFNIKADFDYYDNTNFCIMNV